MSASLTIEPRKKVKPYLRDKRRLQRFSEKSVRAIAKDLRIPFAIDAAHAREIAMRRWANAERPTPNVQFRSQRATPFAAFRVWRPVHQPSPINHQLSRAA